MADAIVLRETGGPEVLRLETVEIGPPGPNEARVRQTAIGVNFHDCYVRSGLYRTLPLPGVPGLEAAGVVTAVGAAVAALAVGDRVAYFTAGYGAYASERLIDADTLVKLPEGVADRTAAATLVKGLTARMLLFDVCAVGPGDTILVQAAAGGVGLLLCQWARKLGARVIGTAGGPDKAALARAAGCDDVILYREEDFVARVRALTDGRGVDIAYDSVGGDTFSGSLDCLADRGHLVNFGQSSGPVAPFEISRLSRGSYSLTRPMLFHYTAGRERLLAMSNALFAAFEDGTLATPDPTVFPLAEAAAAHAALEARRTTGSVILEPVAGRS